MGRRPASLHVAHLVAPERPPAPTPQTRILTGSLHVCFDDTIEALGQMPFPPSMAKVRRWPMSPEMATLTGRCLLARGQWGLLFLTFSLRRPCPSSAPAVHGHHRFRVPVQHHSQRGSLSHCPSSVLPSPSLLRLRLLSLPFTDDRPSPRPLAHALSPACERISPDNLGVIPPALAHAAVLLLGPLPC